MIVTSETERCSSILYVWYVTSYSYICTAVFYILTFMTSRRQRPNIQQASQTRAEGVVQYLLSKQQVPGSVPGGISSLKSFKEQCMCVYGVGGVSAWGCFSMGMILTLFRLLLQIIHSCNSASTQRCTPSFFLLLAVTPCHQWAREVYCYWLSVYCCSVLTTCSWYFFKKTDRKPTSGISEMMQNVGKEVQQSTLFLAHLPKPTLGTILLWKQLSRKSCTRADWENYNRARETLESCKKQDDVSSTVIWEAMEHELPSTTRLGLRGTTASLIKQKEQGGTPDSTLCCCVAFFVRVLHISWSINTGINFLIIYHALKVKFHLAIFLHLCQ